VQEVSAADEERVDPDQSPQDVPHDSVKMRPIAGVA
jgi:hypothetical protein